MSEHTLPQHSRFERAVASVAVLSLAALAVAGCGGPAKGFGGNNKQAIERTLTHGTPSIEPCFDKPVPTETTPTLPNPPTNINLPNYNAQETKWEAQEYRWSRANDPSTIDLNPMPGIKGYIDGDPISPGSNNNESTLVNADVEVSTNLGEGSGAVIKGPDGQDLIITAYHVVAGETGPITITDSNEDTTTVESGCYEYQYDGKPASVKGMLATDTQSEGTVDYAILVPKHHIGSATLKLATTIPTRDTWLQFINVQSLIAGGEANIGDPATPSEYDGLVIDDADGSEGLVALTGIEPGSDGKGEWDEDTLTPGGSGGMVVKGTTIEAISTNSEVNQDDFDNGTVDGLSWSDADSEYNLKTAKAIQENTGYLPNDAGLVPAAYILYGVEHGRYDAGSFAIPSNKKHRKHKQSA
jgi:hypothetical protein